MLVVSGCVSRGRKASKKARGKGGGKGKVRQVREGEKREGKEERKSQHFLDAAVSGHTT